MSQQFTREELVDVWRRSMDASYTDSIENAADGRGLDVISAIATVLERVSEAVKISTQSLYLKPHSTQTAPPASGGVKAINQIEVIRDRQLNAGRIFLVAGDEIAVSHKTPDGDTVLEPLFGLTENLNVEGFGTITAQVVAQREGPHGNIRPDTPGVFTRRGTTQVVINTITPGTETVVVTLGEGGSFLPTMLGQFLRVLTGTNAGLQPARITGFVSETDALADLSELGYLDQTGGTAEVIDVADLGLTVKFTGASTPGVSAELDMLARERGQGRASGETDDSLRSRVCVLADTISPNALLRGVGAVLNPFGIDFRLIEIQDVGGFVFGFHAFGDPGAYQNGRVFTSGSVAGALVSIGFLVVVDGTQFPVPPDAAIGALLRVVAEIKGSGVPFAIAFEPPLP